MNRETNGWDAAIKLGFASLGAVVLCFAFWCFKPIASDGTTPAPKPVVVSPSQVLKQCYEADRVSQIAIIKGMATHPKPGTEEAIQWAVSEGTKRRSEAFRPFFDMLAEYTLAAKEAELAAKLEAGK